jgi:aconitase A
LEIVQAPGQKLTITADDGKRTFTFQMLVRIDTPQELHYYQHQGILQALLRRMAG